MSTLKYSGVLAKVAILYYCKRKKTACTKCTMDVRCREAMLKN